MQPFGSPPELTRTLSELAEIQRLRIIAMKLYAIPMMLFFALVLLLAVLSGFDNYHPQTVHWWDMVRYASVVVSTGLSSIIAGYCALTWCLNRNFSGWASISIVVGIGWSLLTAISNYFTWFLIERQLYLSLVKPSIDQAGFTPMFTNSLPSALPVLSIIGGSTLWAICLVFCLPVSLYACFYLRRSWLSRERPNPPLNSDPTATIC